MPRETIPPPGDPGPYRALIRPPKARHIDVIDQRALPHALVKVNIGDAEAAALAIRRMWIRGAPLIGAVGRLWPGAGARPRRQRRCIGQGARRARRDAPDGRQPALGAGPGVHGGAAAGRFRARGCRMGRSRCDCRRGHCHQLRDRRARARAAARHCAAAARTDRRDDALQRRRAGDLRLGHRDGPPVPRARRRPGAARMGERDAPAHAGRQPHRVGTGPARHSAHAVHRQRQRPAAAAWRCRRGVRRRRPRRAQRRCLQQDRHLRQGACCARQQRALLRRAAVADHRLEACHRRRPFPSRRAKATRC